MVAVVVTPHIRQILADANLEESIEKGNVSSVSHKVLSMALKRINSSQTLLSVLRGCEVHLTAAAASEAHAPPPRRNPELENRLTALRMAAEDAEYARMVADVAPTALTPESLASTRFSRVGAQMSLGANVIVSMATCFAAGYFLGKHTFGNSSVGLAAGLIGMIGAMGVEALLLVTRMYAIDKADANQNKKRLRRTKEAAVLQSKESTHIKKK